MKFVAFTSADLCFQCCWYFFQCLHVMHCHPDKKSCSSPTLSPSWLKGKSEGGWVFGGELAKHVPCLKQGQKKSKSTRTVNSVRRPEVLSEAVSSPLKWNSLDVTDWWCVQVLPLAATLSQILHFSRKRHRIRSTSYLCCIVVTVSQSCLLYLN